MNYKLKINLPYISLEVDHNDDNDDLFKFLGEFFDFIETKQDYITDRNKSLEINSNNLVKKESKENKSILIADTSEILKNVKDLASNLFKFTPEGDVIYKINKENLTNSESIFLVCLEHTLLFEEQLIDNPNINTETICEKLFINKNQANARLSDLVKTNVLKRIDRGEYKINLYGIDEIIKNIVEKNKS